MQPASSPSCILPFPHPPSHPPLPAPLSSCILASPDPCLHASLPSCILTFPDPCLPAPLPACILPGPCPAAQVHSPGKENDACSEFFVLTRDIGLSSAEATLRPGHGLSQRQSLPPAALQARSPSRASRDRPRTPPVFPRIAGGGTQQSVHTFRFRARGRRAAELAGGGRHLAIDADRPRRRVHAAPHPKPKLLLAQGCLSWRPGRGRQGRS